MVVNQSSYRFLRNNTYYFSRRVPLDVKNLYGSNRIISAEMTIINSDLDRKLFYPVV